MKKKKILRMLTVSGLASLLIIGQGCSYMPGSGGDEDMEPVSLSETEAASSPYHPKDFKEILIPSIMEFDREKSMYVKSQDFNGGILHFSGRAETNSLITFFENTMPSKGWTLSGSVKTKKTLLIFTKPGKTCMISIVDPDFSLSTQVSLYISEKNT